MARTRIAYGPASDFAGVILKVGEIVFVTTTGQVFVGDGDTIFENLSPFSTQDYQLNAYPTLAALQADVSRANGTLGYVYANNGTVSDPANNIYQFNSGSGTWTVATWYFNVLTDRVKQFAADQASAAAASAQAAALSASTLAVAAAQANQGVANAQAAVARSEEILLAVQQAAAGGPVLPAGQRINTGNITIADLKSLPSDAALGSIYIMTTEGREGVWQIRAGDYAARCTADPLNTLYVKMDAWPANQRAVERVVATNNYRFAWTGLTALTADAFDYLKAGCTLFPANSDWELPNFTMNLPRSQVHDLPIDKAGVRLYGHGYSSFLNYTGPDNTGFRAVLRVGASDVTVENLRIAGVAPNTSASNPAALSIEPFQYNPNPISRVTVRNLRFDRTSTGIRGNYYFSEANVGTRYITRPDHILCENIVGSTNGVGFSMFGAQDFEIRDYDLTYDGSLGGGTSAKIGGLRALGSENGRVTNGTIRGFESGLIFDLAYAGVGSRKINKNITVDGLRMMGDVKHPIVLNEGTGSMVFNRISVPEGDLNSTDRRVVVEINGNAPSGTTPSGEDPFNHVGDVTISNFETKGQSVGIVCIGEMGNLTVNGMKMTGNKNVSNNFTDRGAIVCTGQYGNPKNIEVDRNDWLLLAGTNAPMQLNTRTDASGKIVVTSNRLPEDNPVISAGNAPIYNGDVEQRMIPAGNINLGTNTAFPVGALANARDGTPIPRAAAPVATAWTRNLVKSAESPTNTFKKTSGPNDTPDAAVYSTQRIVGDFEFVYRVIQDTNGVMVGISPDATGAGFGSIYYGILYNYLGASIYYIGGSSQSQTGAWATDSVERWYRQGTRLKFSRNTRVILDFSVSPDIALGLHALFWNIGQGIEIIRFGAI